MERMSDLLRMAASSTQGMFVAPSTKMPSLLFPTPERNRLSFSLLRMSGAFLRVAPVFAHTVAFGHHSAALHGSASLPPHLASEPKTLS